MKIEEIVVGETYAYSDHPMNRRTRNHIVPAQALVLDVLGDRARVRMQGRTTWVSAHSLMHTWGEELAFREELAT